MRLLRLRDRGWSYALEPGRVVALAGTTHLQRNPRAGGPLGWLLDTPEETPVFTLDAGAEDGGGVVVVLTASDGPPFGLRVDAVEGEHEVAGERLRPLPGGLAACCGHAFSRVVMWDDGMALELAATHPEGLSRGEGGAGDAAAGAQAGPDAWPPAAGPAAALAAERAELPPVSSAQSRRLFVFTLPGVEAAVAAAGSPIVFGLAASQVVEVTDSHALRPVPGARPPLLGLVGWRGEPLAVVDLAGALGFAAAPAATPAPVEARAATPPATEALRLVIARAAGARELVAFRLGRALGVLDGPFPQKPLPAPPFAGARGLRGAFADGARRLLVPDLDWLLSFAWQESWAADREIALPWR